MYEFLSLLLPAVGAAGAGVAAIVLIRSVPAWAVRLSPALAARSWALRWLPVKRMPKVERAARRGQHALDRIVAAAGRPLGWSAARWLAVGALGGFAVGAGAAFQFGGWVLVPAWMAATPALIFWMLRKEGEVLRRRRQIEMVRLIDGVQVLLLGRSDLYGALQTAAPMLTDLRPQIERMLARWGYNPVRALDEFHAEVKTPETQMVTAVLQHAVLMGAHRSQSFLAQEGEKLDRLRRERGEEILRSRPEVMKFALIFPLIALMALLLFPFVFRVLTDISQY